MARLEKTPFPGFEIDFKDVDGSVRRQKGALKEIEAKHQVVRFPVADGYALYAVVKERPLTLRHVPFMDGYEADPATIRGLRIADVRRQRRADEYFDSRRRRHDEFYASLEPGQAVHYNNGFNEFVRCEVVVKDGENVLRPVALVGEWREGDLPRRLPDGTVREGYHAEKIRTGETMTPNATCIWESPDCVGKDRMPDPTEMEPVDLSVPEMDGRERETARLRRKVSQIQEIASRGWSDPDPAAVLERISELIDAA